MKYQLTDNKKTVNGVELTQIKKISDGKLGGWIEKESNLSQEGNCWVFEDAKVYGNAKVFGEDQICSVK